MTMVLPSPITGAPYFEPGDNPRIDVATRGLTTHYDVRATSIVASTAARDSVYAAAIAGTGPYLDADGVTHRPQVGMRCYVISREGFCFWDGTRWCWESVHNCLMSATRDSAAGATGGGAVPILLMPAVAARGTAGSRRIRCDAGTLVTSTSGACAPRAYVAGPSISGSARGDMQCNLFAVSQQQSLFRSWNVVVAAGDPIAFNLYGIDTGSASVEFTSSYVQVFDLGPTDDPA